MIRYGHRMSKDIDLFFSDPQLLRDVSPTVNDALEDIMADYVDDHLFKRYVMPDGKIDFIKGNPVTELEPQFLEFENRIIYTDSPVEIVAKKIFYRSEDFRVRDVFDQAVVLLNGGEDDLAVFCENHPEQTTFALEQTLKRIKDGSLDIGLADLDVLPPGEEARQLCGQIVSDFFLKVIPRSKRPKFSL